MSEEIDVQEEGGVLFCWNPSAAEEDNYRIQLTLATLISTDYHICNLDIHRRSSMRSEFPPLREKLVAAFSKRDPVHNFMVVSADLSARARSGGEPHS